jgi:threonine synthase
MYSYLSHLECPKCHETYDADRPQGLCGCGSPLLARYDLDALKPRFGPELMSGRPWSLWRYHELLPVRDPGHAVSLGESVTPLLPLSRYGAGLGLSRLFLKDEGLLPTGSFKARGAAVGVSRARELGLRTLAMPTNGNAGSAWAAYAARAGLGMKIVMPKKAPVIPRHEAYMTGADLRLVDGLISDAGKIVGRSVACHGWFDVSTLKEPYRIEGKKTMGLEIVEQMGWAVPDVILYPTGGGVGLIGIYKALEELTTLGIIPEGRWPRLVAVQADGCAPIVRAFQEGRRVSEFWENAETVAFGITVPKALGDFLVLHALYETQGTAVTVPDAEILEEQRAIGRTEGLYICPEGAATLAALKRLVESGFVRPEDTVVALNTGAGLKYPETVRVDVPEVELDAILD